jgi:uncharacterized protein (PEP-CTERM system associated)
MIITMAKRRVPVARFPAVELVAPIALLGLVLSAPAVAEVTVKPAIAVRETYSDNPQLRDDENARGQLITDVSPSVDFIVNSPRVKLTGQVSSHLYAYSGGSSDNTNNSTLQLATAGKANIIEDLLYLDGAASRSRQSISAFGPQYQSGYSDANTDVVTTYRVSPYLIHRFGAFAVANVRYTRDSVKSSRNALGDSTSDSVNLDLSSGPKFTTVRWDLFGYHQQLHDNLSGNSDVDNAVGTLRYRLHHSLDVYGKVGYDRYTYQGLSGTTGGKSEALGFTWTPSLRTSIDASVGHRYFGKTYSLAAVVRSRRTIWNLSYNDDITTSRAQFLQPGSIDTASLLDASFASAFPDPILRRQAIDAFIRANGLPTSVANNINYFSNRLLLQKQFLGSFVLNGSRSMAIFSLSSTKRTALSPAGVDASTQIINGLNDNTDQRTGTMSFNYRFSPRFSTTLTASKSLVKSLTTGIDQNQNLLSFTVNRQFSRRLTGYVELRRNTGDTFGFAGGIYHENAITAALSYQL